MIAMRRSIRSLLSSRLEGEDVATCPPKPWRRRKRQKGGSPTAVAHCALVLSAVFGTFSISIPALAQPASRGDAQKGQQLYVAKGCSYCHGTMGQGARGIVRLVQPRPMPFDAYLAQLRRPSGEMPPFVEAVVSQQDAADIYAFTASLPQPPDVGTIPILNE